MFYCRFCKERWFDKEQAEKGLAGECKTCFSQRTDKKGSKHRLYAKENDADPVPNDNYPFHLPKLQPTEHQLIAQAHVIMRAYRMEKGNLGYKGQCLNMQQNVQQFIESLPTKVEDLPLFWMRKRNQGTPSGYRDFRVRCDVIRQWLVWLKANNPLYFNIIIDEEEIDRLPDDGDVMDRVPSHEEEEQEEEAAEGEQANREDESEENGQVGTNEYAEDEDVPMNLNGPDQGGATGSIDNEEGDDRVTRGFIGIPVNETNRSVNEQIHDILRERFGTEENPIEWPEAGENLNDFDTPNLQAMAFPALFPFGRGDVTMKDRRTGVKLTESNKHLLKYAIFDRAKNLWWYPFATDKRWMHWAQNTAERHRCQGQRGVYLDKTSEDANITEDELRLLVEKNDDGLKQLISRMQKFNSNVTGSAAYFYKKRCELEALIDAKGMPTMWFTLSAADNHWVDLHKCMYGSDRPLPNLANELAKVKWRRKMTRENPHIVDAYFMKRVQALLDTYYGKTGLELEWSWFRIEYQERGTAHAHGCFRLKCDPGISDLAQKVLKGRIAEKRLVELGYINGGLNTVSF